MDGTQKVSVSKEHPRSLLRDSFACLENRNHLLIGFMILCKSGAHLKVKNGLIHLQNGGLAEPQVKLRIKYN